MTVETITVNAEFICELVSKRDWVNNIPDLLPKKAPGDYFIFRANNGNVFTSGLDFQIAEEKNLYPCRVYRPISIKEDNG